MARTEKLSTVSGAQLVAALTSADQKRALELKSGRTTAAPLVTAEDGSTRVKAFHMAALGSDQTGIEFPLNMARVGKKEGFEVVLRAPVEQEKELKALFAKEKLDNVRLLPVKDGYDLDFWSEDQGEVHTDGSISVPRALTGQLSWEDITHALTKARLERLHPGTRVDLSTPDKLQKAREKYPDVAYSSVGAVAERRGQRALVAIALGAKKGLRVSNGYLEGGNALVGRKADGTGYAVVGADSLTVSREALSKELGRKLSDADTRALIAQDYGVATKDLVVVEQPGDFHIDMHMALLPGGKAVVNDALSVFETQKAWLTEHFKSPPKPPAKRTEAAKLEHELAVEEWKIGKELFRERLSELEQAAKAAAAHEARMVKDLEAQGLEVHRMPGVFPRTHQSPRMNFLNAEQGVNPKGQHFMVLLGGDPRAEAMVKERLSAISGAPVRVHFLDPALTETTLNAMGGLSCRAKVEGHAS